MDKAPEKRRTPRITAILPLQITTEFLGETIDISENGLKMVLEKPLLLTKAQAKVQLSPDESIDTEFKVIWNKGLVKKNKFIYGVCFIRLKEHDLALLRKVLSRSKDIDGHFVDISFHFRDYLVSVRNKFDEFDRTNDSREDRITFLDSQKGEIFEKICHFLKELWPIINNLDKNSKKNYIRFLRSAANYIFIDYGEINKHIFTRPLGYPGDFMIMNYIFNYYKGTYLGDSSYKMLLNHFTCNVPISVSNIQRRDFFKNKISNLVNNSENAKILSVGCGSARELTELLNEGKLKKKFIFHALDLEDKALAFIRGEIDKINNNNKSLCEIAYIKRDYMDLAKNKNLEGLFESYDFVYCSGVFDYLKDRTATRLVDILFGILKSGHDFVLCNANNRDAYSRVAYEIMGDWVFNHREKDEVLNWVRNIKDSAETKFEDLSDTSNYLFLTIKKK